MSEESAKFSISPSGVAKVAAHTGETEQQVRETARRQGFEVNEAKECAGTGALVTDAMPGDDTACVQCGSVVRVTALNTLPRHLSEELGSNAMAVHRISTTVEINVTDEEWTLNYGEVESPEQIAKHVDALVVDAVCKLIDRIGWGTFVQSTPSVKKIAPHE